MIEHGSVTLETADVRLRIASHGGVVTSLVIAGSEILKQGEGYGCFPMVPFCGRLADGRLRTAGGSYQLPRNAPPHAIHGTARDRSWEVVEASDVCATLSHSLTAPWPFAGRVTQRFELTPDGLTLSLEVETDSESFPAQAGWHPWFLRTLGGAPVRLDFTPNWQELRGPDYLPTGTRIEPETGPWDDCFGMPDGVDVTVTWPGRLRLRVRSPAQWVVVYDREPDAVCVEPQSGPPNGVNTMPRLVRADAPLRVESTWSWERL
ncbi:aldose 1-epimerase [Nocardia yunnanensis]|uniref:Aldose 1-epimerase n=1 Tax=Nocardia yunnanensis TaxID=2382165 RepID=A0A386ZCS2_9NOCA|nr:aldose 1-epimerase [Nocardia yunnanensis]AYF74914.1 aldose 1-epimerase [Nocardia yunnanensis]